jgi:antitoxin component HigA of HigAB toxin-antitoxin module
VTRGKKRTAATLDVPTIRSEEDLDRATSEACGLLSLGRDLSNPEQQRLHFLTAAIRTHEGIHHPIPDPSHAALLEHLMDAKGCSPTHLAKATGIPRSNITAYLRGQRQIGTKAAKELAQYFHVERSVFEDEDDVPTVSTNIVWTNREHTGFSQSAWLTITSTSVSAGVKLAQDLFISAWNWQHRQLGPVLAQPFESQFEMGLEPRIGHPSIHASRTDRR